ncbi:MAG TPA: tol-pal system protein YbgF [Candidatus Eisenbacteria bacterium]|nr:tol-pal system protein YbgF [Candidatus Eisenbacteria bacterium]
MKPSLSIKIFFCLLVIAAGWLSSCVNPQQVELLEREQRRQRGDLTNMHADIDNMRSSLADTQANLQQLQRELGTIKERIDETRVQVGRQLGQTNREGDQRVKNLEDRLAKLEQEASNQAELIKARDAELQQLRESMQQAAQRPEPIENSVDLSLAESESVRKEFETAWRSFEKKDYRVAIGRFKDFLKRNPKSKLGPSAQYAIGESYFALKEFDRAILELDEVRRRYPQSDRVAAALLRQGSAFAELGEKLNARLVLQELIERFPQSAEAGRAKQRLKALES